MSSAEVRTTTSPPGRATRASSRAADVLLAPRQVHQHVQREHQVERAVAEGQAAYVALHRVPHAQLARVAQSVAAESSGTTGHPRSRCSRCEK